MEKCIIAAVAEDGAIGKDNGLLWHLPEDLKYFKATTMGCPVIMGRRTFESIGRPLPGRCNIVISKTLLPGHDSIEMPDIKTEPKSAHISHSLIQAFSIAERQGHDRCFIIGGAQLYAEAIPEADRLYITRIHAIAPDADRFFPPIDKSVWSLESASELHTDPKTGITFTFEVYSRNGK